MSNILAVRIASGNRMLFYRSEPYVVTVGDHVLVQVEGEIHMGKVERTTPLAVFESAGSKLPDVSSQDRIKVLYSETSSNSASDEPPVPLEAKAEPSRQHRESTAVQNGEDSNSRGSSEDLQAIFRPATEEDLIRDRDNRELARNAHQYCRQCIVERGLDMKLVEVEVLFDGSKIIFYFTAPNRIDFRELVKDLVRSYRTRIELRQIGARHETQMLGGLGNCGQLVCCQRFLRQFAPSTIKMAKEQNLFLNPAKISGVCNRLLCCLSFEQPNYDEFLNQCPKIGKRYTTLLGSAKVIRANYFRRTLSIFLEPGGEKEIDLDEWKRILSGAREPVQPVRSEQPVHPKNSRMLPAVIQTVAETASPKPEKNQVQSGSEPASESQPPKKSRKSGRKTPRQEGPVAENPGKSKRRSRSSRRKTKKQQTSATPDKS
ncbi:Cell fate regulator YaaT, PSP1 superfamily (controls sporulation, competence, biofilm development) [Desulfonatronum thiosulfatophilum]|uniref:Cell fate regulator YaaT, PSP1 superfamily (Controls sporulation, competence, biofilm development) n=1 Tax=Desulfonatronum thiosulfatophilum TaxID=617002 RepID=A0A1G6E129_9BACT|nr:regulatory iron-sulfur-containing complex subunit RicT [Desulfonatronum thiosulfatophilum]SDB51091.1 Cell fate regulator YaaT, PSP1 superfamily (controls sporulation, competence, biofilm development) [Desulfonatronum thiosulfatophilum]